MIIRALDGLKSFLRWKEEKKPKEEISKKDPEWFCIKLDGKFFLYGLNDNEGEARCYQSAQWWHENPTARLVKVALTEIKPESES